MLIESVWGWRMPSMRAVLETRRKAAAVRVEELEAELDRCGQTWRMPRKS